VTTVTVAHVGLIGAEPTIRKALAIGADDAIRINADPVDAYFVACQLASIVSNGDYGLILCGIESSDYNGSSVGGMLAEFADLTSVSSVSGVKVENGKITLTREIDGGKEILSAEAPVVAVVQKGIAKEPRIAAMRGIMMARTKPLKVLEPTAADAPTAFISFELPKPRAACKFVDPDNAKQLILLLQNEAKII
jgi:electron transfer flavoprotein beta subunit